MGTKYYVGLDMGTSSVGWAVTDEEYKLVRRKGKDMWGVRLFPEAKTAEERRSHRTARRRLQREHARIGMLREMFQEEINKVDPGFYQRLEDSKYFMEDKSEHQKYSLFNDKSFTDREYHEKYPTIAHLRKELIYSKEVHDIRLIYLAILNIYKHRGHFLNENLNDSGMENINKLFDVLNEDFREVYENDFCNEDKVRDVSELLKSRDYSATRKCEKIAEICEISKTKDSQRYEMLKLICGLSGKLIKLFPLDDGEDVDPEMKNLSLNFGSADFDEELAKVGPFIQEKENDIILDLKRINDWGTLANIMEGDDVHYLSEARVKFYEKHKADLSLLKKVYRLYAPELYDDMFRVMKTGNYSAYVGSVDSKHEHMRRDKNRKSNTNRTDDLMAKIKKDVSAMEQNEETVYILEELAKNTFLPKQLTADNGSIPYQLHKMELIKILENAQDYFPFLKEKDQSGLSAAERIVKLFEFRIPYFVGPLRNSQNGTGWSVVNGCGPITPWNITDRIDFSKSEEEFILRMIKRCTYLADEQVVPKESLLYQKFCVLNELNNLKINGEKIPVELKQDIYIKLFRKGKKVTGKGLRSFLEREGHIEKGQDIAISGIDGDFMSTLGSYKKFTEVFGVDTLDYAQEQMAEQIILWGTIHTGEKKILKSKIQDKYGDILSKEQIERLAGYRFKDWGNLSKEFLQMPGSTEEFTIIERMWNTEDNLMELLHGNYGFEETLQEKSVGGQISIDTITHDDLDGMYLSSPVKRMVWQTICILKEIKDVMGCEPAKLFVEMTRGGDDEKKRTESRQKKLEALYKSCQKEEPQLFEAIKCESDSRLRIKKLYLYYMQKGRCMYSGEPINIHDLLEDDQYDIDHIYPRHFRKDDSLENNLVLVNKNLNNRKQDTFPIEESIRKSQTGRWEILKKQGFISPTKFGRLIRNHDFSPEERAEFIARQIVETSQGTKAVANLMEDLFGDTKVVYVKARTVSQFRQQRDIVKVRMLNDLHHANDAYLNIVVGNVYNVKFTSNPMNFVRDYMKDPEKNKYHLYHMFDYDVVRGDEVAWKKGGNGSIAVVKQMLSKGTPLVTYMNFEAHGGITGKDTVYSSATANPDAYIPVNSKDGRLSDVTKYGGRTDVRGTYFFLVEHTVKGKRVRTLEPMFLYMKDTLNSKEALEQYCIEKLGYIEPSVCLEKIKMYSKIRVNGYEMLLTGRSLGRMIVSNAVQLKLSDKDTKYMKKVSSAVEKDYSDEQIKVAELSSDENIKLYDVLLDKHTNGIFSKKPNPIGDKLKVHRDDFVKLTMIEQCKVLTEIVKATGKENNGANLELLNESNVPGKMVVSNEISKYDECVLINQSLTGLYNSRIDLLTI